MVAAGAVRVRFAPSPTGYLHLGGLRTALFNYLFAKKHGGTVVLRLEDTDRSRYVPDSYQRIQQDLKWCGIYVDEGPDEGGPFGPYVQSERTHLYQQYANELVQNGSAYRCFCSPSRLEAVRAVAEQTGRSTAYDGHCRHMNEDMHNEFVASGKPFVVRLKVPRIGTAKADSGVVRVHDRTYGIVDLQTRFIDDQVLLKSDGFPTYHLANVVDDHLMEISHVLRGEEWLLSTAKHQLLYDAFGWTPPEFVHIPLLVNQDGSKLSKRHGSLFVSDLRTSGVLAQSLTNFIARLGWTPREDDENHFFQSLEEMAQTFDIGHIHRNPAVVSFQKMEYFNRLGLRNLERATQPFQEALAFVTGTVKGAFQDQQKTSPSTMAAIDGQIVPTSDGALDTFSEDYIAKALDLAKGTCTGLKGFAEEFSYLWSAPEISPEAAQEFLHSHASNSKAVKGCLVSLRKAFAEPLAKDTDSAEAPPQEHFAAKHLQLITNSTIKNHGLKKKEGYMALRFALTGFQAGPPLFAIAELLGKQRTLQRLDDFLGIAAVPAS